jgi:multisubunit Na+/H+ antiporter MnhE subunit
MTVPGRAIVFLLLWLVLAGMDLVDLAVGVGTALAAAWLSGRLWPSSGVAVRPPGGSGADGGLMVHWLDVADPVAARITAEREAA